MTKHDVPRWIWLELGEQAKNEKLSMSEYIEYLMEKWAIKSDPEGYQKWCDEYEEDNK